MGNVLSKRKRTVDDVIDGPFGNKYFVRTEKETLIGDMIYAVSNTTIQLKVDTFNWTICAQQGTYAVLYKFLRPPGL